jgi:hypothetical protein
MKEPVIDLGLSARIEALELLVLSLIKRSPELQNIVASSRHDRLEELSVLGQITGRPVRSNVTDELQEAWGELLSRAQGHARAQRL